VEDVDPAEKMLSDEILKCSEELGDLVMPLDPNLTLSIYRRVRDNVPTNKAITCLVLTNQFDCIQEYAKEATPSPDIDSLHLSVISIGSMQKKRQVACPALTRATFGGGEFSDGETGDGELRR